MGWSIADALNRPVRMVNNPDIAEAKEKGLKHYRSIPCKRCGFRVRQTTSGDCIMCKKQWNRRDYFNLLDNKKPLED